ncbi:DNA-directed RNA polymerase subunit P [Candidatus Marsarchaeota archaeon]|jgi:DNA-directed RNA polymerase subunit RPC12/RpoP|nr:DNA-directed RNA polymerase subunit P [Candidatus Marsarchaeota archaeon]
MCVHCGKKIKQLDGFVRCQYCGSRVIVKGRSSVAKEIKTD